MTARLELKNLTKSFAGLRAVDEVNISFHADGIEGVIGPNGAGKTTLFRLLSGFAQPDSGEILLDGRSLEGIPAHKRARRGIARTFQEQEVFPELSVGDVLTTAALMRYPLDKAKHQAQEAIEELDLPWSAIAGELTPAQIRRLELARVEVVKPEVALFDEVMAGLTSSETQFMADRIRKLSDSGVTVIVVEHVMEVVMQLCETIHVLVAGKFIVSGTPQQVANDPRVIEAYLGRRNQPHV